MQNGYKIFWTDNALQELNNTIEYLQNSFSDKEINKLASEIEKTINVIAKFPKTFPESGYPHVRKVAILKYNTMYYRIIDTQIEILSFFSNRQKPRTNKF
ncbi:type II toxin-antitoxin system RelE/ParE family toxin [Polluticaenibacter yanchengensis]|uniref:Type II toxin-antitoxin system RelE/ParE family toxin n=1 Tax=Polluticaenibacter yanchengensis TaxID=3014562 RepID=A0ABT4UNI1_9BACT|nr:type II toxin-antitoxin system RelE/ParE family toxin [Chitinophagaceae bacterium LY-5]